jgi:hypothetical protein
MTWGILICRYTAPKMVVVNQQDVRAFPEIAYLTLIQPERLCRVLFSHVLVRAEVERIVVIEKITATSTTFNDLQGIRKAVVMESAVQGPGVPCTDSGFGLGHAVGPFRPPTDSPTMRIWP